VFTAREGPTGSRQPPSESAAAAITGSTDAALRDTAGSGSVCDPTGRY